jgi:hypothetical protein
MPINFKNTTGTGITNFKVVSGTGRSNFKSTTSIVTTGLILSLDAGNPSSYPGSGATWTDTIQSKAFTLFNTPTYSSNNGGYLSFAPGSSQYASSATSLTSSLTNFTMEAWVSVRNYPGTNAVFISNRDPALDNGWLFDVTDLVYFHQWLEPPSLGRGTYSQEAVRAEGAWLNGMACVHR